ncbi:phosphotransferase [Actinoplanes sp. NPDC051470]|uniref:phosphotransferase n=1 Tax=Actinoplanes sp. NPDC051470 TaxID=3157224 RepID=UPI003422F192
MPRSQRAHDATLEVEPHLARQLVDNQFPAWAGRPLRRWEQAGSDHVIYRLGDELSVRFPRHTGAIGQARKEMEWLPRLAPHLPLSIPVPVAVGEPALGYPWAWAVAGWLPGAVATMDELGRFAGCGAYPANSTRFSLDR